MSQLTTASATVPDPGVIRSCTAATACPHVVLGADPAEAALMLADHHWEMHGIGRKETGR